MKKEKDEINSLVYMGKWQALVTIKARGRQAMQAGKMLTVYVFKIQQLQF